MGGEDDGPVYTKEVRLIKAAMREVSEDPDARGEFYTIVDNDKRLKD